MLAGLLHTFTMCCDLVLFSKGGKLLVRRGDKDIADHLGNLLVKSWIAEFINLLVRHVFLQELDSLQ